MSVDVKVELSPERHAARVIAVGDLDVHSVGSLHEVLDKLFDLQVSDLEVDLSEAHLLDATAAAALLHACRQERRTGGAFRLTGVNADSRRLMHEVGLDRALAEMLAPPAHLPAPAPATV